MRFFFWAVFIFTLGCGKKFKDGMVDAEPLFTFTGASQVVPKPREIEVQKMIPKLKTEKEKSDFIIAQIRAELDPNIQDYATLWNLAHSPQNKSTFGESQNIMNLNHINFYDVKSLYKKEGYVAVCRKSSKSGRKEILIDKSYWEGASEDLRKTLMIHELGHCLLGRGHFVPTANLKSIMEAMLINNYKSNTKACYANELFFPQKSCTPK